MNRTMVILIAVTIFCSCNNSKPEENIPVKPPKKIDKINFFMETSASMAGYLRGATEFKNDIPNLLVNIEGKIDSGVVINNYFIADSVTPFNGNTQAFINEISVKTPAIERSSQMHKIFQMIADKTDSSDISIFVSDCILSYPDADIRENPEINRQNAPGELKSQMTTAFQGLQRKNNICASLYGFNSAFTGTYYTYQNAPLKLTGDINRPYYMWVIGNKELLMKFNQQLKGLSNFRPTTVAIDFGIFSEPVTDYTVLFKYQRSGDWATDYKELNDVEATAKDKAVFAIVADLSSLPPYITDTAYLKENFKKTPENLSFDIRRIFLTKEVDRSKLKEKEKNMIEGSTHVFIIEITDIYDDGVINLKLPLQYDTSYRKLSIMDDRNMADVNGKTFAFEHMVDGVRNAYQNNNQSFIQISIPVKK